MHAIHVGLHPTTETNTTTQVLTLTRKSARVLARTQKTPLCIQLSAGTIKTTRHLRSAQPIITADSDRDGVACQADCQVHKQTYGLPKILAPNNGFTMGLKHCMCTLSVKHVFSKMLGANLYSKPNTSTMATPAFRQEAKLHFCRSRGSGSKSKTIGGITRAR